MDQLGLFAIDLPRKKKYRQSISIAVKLQIINRIRNGERASAVARSMKLPESTVRTIYKDANRILECSENANSLSSKVISRKRSKIMERLECELCDWMSLMSDRAVDVSLGMIQEKALEIFNRLQAEEPEDSPYKEERFTASRGWFDRFKKRQNICLTKCGYEKVAVTSSYNGGSDEMQFTGDDTARPSSSADIIIPICNSAVKEEIDEPLETADEYLEFQMVVDETDNDESSSSLCVFTSEVSDISLFFCLVKACTTFKNSVQHA